ncbi:MAG: membrane dipeptidase [Rhodospirillales bacterium]|nr:membrane dipeptidase [Rhodospirillales bacterium]
MTHNPLYIIDGLQYCRWDREIFEQMREGRVTAVHVTIAYWENFRETVANIQHWNRLFEDHGDLIVHARSADDVRSASAQDKTAIIFGFQNCSPMEDDLGLIEVLYDLGARIMQLSYNNQSLLATGCYEADDPGITRFGKQAIKEMNRLGLVIDMSHSAERSTLDAIELSERPIAITHANPSFWEPALRNKSDRVLKAMGESGGMIGFSLYPYHLKGKSACPLDDFCAMAARAAELIGVDRIGIGSDLCQGHDDSVVTWMRNGRWTRDTDFGEGNKGNPGWPDPVPWFRDNRDFSNITQGLMDVGFDADDVDKIMGLNWLYFFETSFQAHAK